MHSRQLVILVGGRGTRLGDLSKQTPKPLMQIDEHRVFLDYFLDSAVKQGFTDVLLLAGHMGEQVVDRYADTRFGEANLSVLVEPQPMGTAGAFSFAKAHLADTFVAANGDTLFDTNLRAIDAELYRHPAIDAVIGLREVSDVGRYGSVSLDSDGKIIGFNEKAPQLEGVSGLINGGVYAMRRRVIENITTLPSSIETDVFPMLACAGRLRAIERKGYFLDIGLPETLAQARDELPKRKRPALFLDRDGVVNVDHGYTHKIEDWKWNDGAIDLIKWANDNSFYVFIVTNQAGIAHGYYDESDFNKISTWMNLQLHQHGAFIDHIYYSPYHPNAVTSGLQVANPLCRKPCDGMLRRALRQYRIDKSRSILIGDQSSDIEAAERSGIVGIKYQSGNLFDFFNHFINSN